MDEPIRPAEEHEQLLRLYERHMREPDVCAVIAAYEAAYLAVRECGAKLRSMGESRMSTGVDARAADLLRQAIRHVDAMCQRAENER